MSELLSKNAEILIESTIKDALNVSLGEKKGKMQRKPNLQYNYYSSKLSDKIIVSLDLTVTSHHNKLIITIDISLNKESVPDELIGSKHSITEIEDNVDSKINNIIQSVISSNSRGHIPSINLYNSGVEPNTDIDAINREGEIYPAVSYYDRIGVNLK